tara:strand:+ start:224 stop:553 length:330 start_codon:yes stop_codon:yes gene_type:complete
VGARSNQHHQERTNNTKKKKKKKKTTTKKVVVQQKVGELQLGRLQSLQKAPWDSLAVRSYYENNEPDCVQYLLDNDCPLPPGWRYEDGELRVPTDSSESDLTPLESSSE